MPQAQENYQVLHLQTLQNKKIFFFFLVEKFTKQEVDPPISHLNFLFFSIFLDWDE